MKTETYWNWFCATGDPLVYVMYRTAEAEINNGPMG